MAKQIINIGQSANDRSGDPLRTAFEKVNNNFTELYTLTGGASAALTELAQDYAAPLLNHASHTNITATYDDANNKILLTGVAAQIQSDWDQTNNVSLDFIKNKPTIPTSFNKLESGNAQVSLANNGVFYLADNPEGTFTLTFTAENYVATELKPTLTLSDDPWTVEGEYVYNAVGESSLALGSIGPQLVNPGYESGDTFTFDESVHGRVGYELTITLNDVVQAGLAGWTASATESPAPGYPSSIKKWGPIKLTALSRNWTFGTDGVLYLPNSGGDIRRNGVSVLGGSSNSLVNGSHTVSLSSVGLTAFPAISNESLFIQASELGSANASIGISAKNNVIVTANILDTAKQWIFGTDGTLSLPADPGTPVLTVEDIVPTPRIYRATDSNDPAAVRSAFEIWYANEQEFEAYRNEGGTGYPWDGLPSWEAYPLIMNYVSGGPGQLPPSPNFAPVAKTAQDSYLAWKELESNIDIQSGNKTFSFENTGSLSLPGELTFTDTTNAKIVVGKLEQLTWTFGLGNGMGSITFPNGSVQTTAYTSTPFDRLVLGFSEVVLGLDGALTIGTGAGKIHTGGVPAADLADFETAYNAAEELYSAELTVWMTVNSHTPAWFTLPGKDAYGVILESNYSDDPQWQGIASLTDRAGNAQNAYTLWQGNLLNSKLSVKSDTAIFAFDSTNKLTLSQGGVISGGDPAAIQAAYDDWQADEADWQNLITEGGTNLNVRPWNFAGPSRAEKKAVLLAMWTAQNEVNNVSELGWIPISASFYNQVRTWLGITVFQDGYDEWKKLTTSVNITADDKTWTFANDGSLTVANGGTITNIIPSNNFGPTPERGRRLSIAPSANSSTKTFTFRVDENSNVFNRAYLEMPTAEVDKQVAISFDHANGTSGSIFTQGADTNDYGLNNAFNIFYNSGDIKLTAQAGGGSLNIWKFGNDGRTTFPDNTVQETAFQDVASHVFFVHPNPGRTFTATGTYNSPFATITAAVNAAVAAGHSDSDSATIILLANITENVTLKPGIWLTSLGTGTHGSPTITGTVTVTSSTGTTVTNHYSLSYLRIVAPTNGHCINFTGTAPQKLFIRDMWLDANGTGDGIYMDNTGSGSTVQFDIGHLAHSGTGDIYCINVTKGSCYVTDIETTGATQVAAVQTGAVLTIDGSELVANGDIVCETYGTGTLTITNSIITNIKANSTGVKINDAGGIVTIGNNLITVPAGTGYALQGPAGGIVYHANNVFTTNAYRSTGLGAGFIALPTTWSTKA